MDILYQDNSILVCIKPAGVLSTDEPGGVPELVRQALGDPKACVRTVHRLDRVVSGLMVLARTPAAASKLSAQIREHDFGKTYLAVVHGEPDALQGTYRDLLRRDDAPVPRDPYQRLPGGGRCGHRRRCGAEPVFPRRQGQLGPLADRHRRAAQRHNVH